MPIMTRTMRTFTAAGTLAAALLTPALARAQTREEFGERGQFILSADRLVPLFSWSRVAQNAFPSNVPATDTQIFTTDTQTSFSFFWGATPEQETIFTVPRIGFDYVVIPHLTVGGDIVVYFTVGGGTSTETDFTNGGSQTRSQDVDNFLVFGIAPRVGYVLRLSNLFSLWLRGGLSFYTETASHPNNTHDNTDQFALDLEPQFVFTPVPHFGITAALDGDIPLAGQHSTTDFTNRFEQSAASSIAYFGVTLGMLGYF
jgi:hypothetical protein